MKGFYKYGFFISLIVIAILLLMQDCSSGTGGVSSSVDTVWIPSKDKPHKLPLPEIIEKPVPYEVQVPVPGDTIWMPKLATKEDTLKILADYYLKRSYNDSITNDSLSIYLQEEVYKNELKRVKIGYRWKAPTMLIKETKVVNNQLLFVGLEPYGNLNSFGMFASADFDTKKAMFGYGYDPFNKFHKISVKAKIKLWNKKN